MLPVPYQIPAVILMLLAGVVACFFGYRLFRIVLALSGFLLGAFASSSVFGVSDTAPMLIAAILGGLLGAALLIGAYFVGTALAGAALGALVAHLAFSGTDAGPHVAVVLLCTIAGAVASMYLQRYVIIV